MKKIGKKTGMKIVMKMKSKLTPNKVFNEPKWGLKKKSPP